MSKLYRHGVVVFLLLFGLFRLFGLFFGFLFFFLFYGWVLAAASLLAIAADTVAASSLFRFGFRGSRFLDAVGILVVVCGLGVFHGDEFRRNGNGALLVSERHPPALESLALWNVAVGVFEGTTHRFGADRGSQFGFGFLDQNVFGEIEMMRKGLLGGMQEIFGVALIVAVAVTIAAVIRIFVVWDEHPKGFVLVLVSLRKDKFSIVNGHATSGKFGKIDLDSVQIRKLDIDGNPKGDQFVSIRVLIIAVGIAVHVFQSRWGLQIQFGIDVRWKGRHACDVVDDGSRCGILELGSRRDSYSNAFGQCTSSKLVLQEDGNISRSCCMLVARLDFTFHFQFNFCDSLVCC